MSKLSVKKPFTVLVGVIAALVLGFVSLTRMQLDLLPEISLPYLLVITTYPGASPETVEEELVKPMEAALGTINGVENVYGVCNENYGMVQLEFQDDTDIDSAMVKVSSALNSLEALLPDDCGTPSIVELGTDMLASVYLAVSYDGMEIEEISKFVEDTVTPEFERQDGVASVSEMGLVEKSIQVELNEEKISVLNDKILGTLDSAFADAVEQLDDAKKQLEESGETIQESKEKLKDSENDLYESMVDLNDGQKELNTKKGEFDQSVIDYEEGKEELEKGEDKLNKAKSEALGGINAALEGLKGLKSYYTETHDTPIETSIAGMETAIAGIDSLNNTIGLYSDEYIPDSDKAYLEGSLSALGIDVNDPVQDIISGLAGAKTEMSGKLELLNKLKDGIEGLEAKGIAVGNAKEVTEAISEMEQNKLITNASFAVPEYQIATGKAQLEAAEKQFETGSKQLKDAQEQIDESWEKIRDGQQQIWDGWDDLKDGEKKLADGWQDYNDAVKKYEKQRVEAEKKANADDLLKLETLAQLIYAQNFEMPAGYVDDELDNSWLIRVGQNYEEVKELEDVVLCNIHNVGDVKLGDVADITVIDNALDSYVRLGSEKGVILSIFKSSVAGTNDVSKVVKETIKELQEKYPGLNILVLTDQGDYINMIVKSVLQSMAIGAILAIIVLAFFLKDVKPTLVVAISIPLSVLIALIAMYFTDISLNMLSLSGLALGIGMLVDNSIVVIENIYRLRGKGVEAPRAAVQGTKQVAGAIISSTLTTVCVFLPMIYTTGLVRELMAPMCLTIVYCLMASLFVAMTVVPAASSTVLRKAKTKEHKLFDKVQDAYGTALDFCLRFKFVPLLAAIGLLGLTGWLVVRMGIVVIPDITMNQIQASIEYPDEYDRDTCYDLTDQTIERLLTVEGIDSIGVMAGDDTAIISGSIGGSRPADFRNMQFMITTSNPDAGEEEVKKIMSDMVDSVSDIDVELNVQTASSEMDAMMGGSGLSISVFGDDIDGLLQVTGDLMEVIDGVEGFSNISNGAEDADKVVHLIVDKNKAMSMGLSVAQIFASINDKIDNEAKSVTINVDGMDMEIGVVDNIDPLTKENLLDYTFTVDAYDEDDDQITEEHKLSEFAKIEVNDGVSTIRRENQGRYMTITADVDEGYNITLLTRELQPLLEEYQMPEGYSYSLGGEYDSVITMVKQMLLVMVLGGLFIYLVMVAQFQSLLSPFIVLFTIPLAFTGGFLSLWLTRENLSVLSMMGFVVLMGTVVNNGIVFVDYTNQLRKGGLDRKTALIATGKTRMRPILMTALTTILAESNLIMGDDMGSQLGRGMALVIAGGLTYATLMTLFIIPVMYDILFKKQPLDIDTGSESLDDVPDDAAEYMASLAENNVTEDTKTE